LCRGARDGIPAGASCGANADLYRRHHRNLQRAVSRVVDAPPELIEDACQNAWTIFLRANPDRASIFDWLLAVATREAHRLSEADRPCAGLDAGPAASCIEDVLEAREALHVLASLPDRQREDLALAIAGFSYDEIAEITGARTASTVRKQVAKAHARVQRERHGRT
jgi:DNA-directed RNA polymerase specialized sigma24 family protein